MAKAIPVASVFRKELINGRLSINLHIPPRAPWKAREGWPLSGNQLQIGYGPGRSRPSEVVTGMIPHLKDKMASVLNGCMIEP